MTTHRIQLLLTTILGASMAMPASAQLIEDEIIVTAQRKSEKLSETPVSVSILSADTLKDAQIATEEDLRVVVPGLAVRATVNSNQINYAIRGQSQDAFSGTRPGVLPYVNEVQIGGIAAGTSSFYDLNSIQALKGPQGTLFGRSATGGAVLITTQAPIRDEVSGYISLLGGDHGALKGEGAFNAGTEELAVRVAGFYEERDGFQENLFNGETEGDLERFGGRFSLSMDFSDSVTNDFMIDHFQSDSESTTPIVSGLLPLAAPGSPPFVPIQLLYGGVATPVAAQTGAGVLGAFVGFDLTDPTQFATAAAVYNGYFADPTHPNTGFGAFVADQAARGPFVVNFDGPNIYEANNTVITNSTTFEINDNLTLKNIIGYTNLYNLISVDSDASPYGISQNAGSLSDINGVNNSNEQFSEELQLSGTAADGRLDFTTGVYYQDETYTLLQDTRFFDILFGGQMQINAAELTNETLAAYGQGTYDLNDNGLAITAGLRYTSEKAGKNVDPQDSVRAAVGENQATLDFLGFDYNQSKTFDHLSWQVGIQNQFSPELLGYIVSRRAVKSGGFNTNLGPKVGGADIGGDGYRSEEVTDAEIGFKYAGIVSDRPVRFNVAAFHNWLTDSQRTAYTLIGANPATVTVNVPKGKVYGLEADGQFGLTDWLTIGGAANYINSQYTDGNVIANGAAQIFDQVPDAPEFSGTFYADAVFPVSDGWDLKLHGDTYSQSSTSTTPRSLNSFGTKVDGYTLANFRVGFANDDNGMSVTANLKNAFDKVYFAGGLPTGEIFQINNLIVGNPRTFTVELRKQF